MTVGPGHVWKRLIVDLGNRELSPGLTFVALSRACELGCVLFGPGTFPTWDCLALCKPESISVRQQIDRDLDAMSRKLEKTRAFRDLLERGLGITP